MATSMINRRMFKNSMMVAIWIFAIVKFSAASSDERTLTAEEIKSVSEAVQDEIYDLGVAPRYVDLGSKMVLYIRPTVKAGVGQVVYKLLPWGEVTRLFSIKNGRVVLDGDPLDGFPPTSNTFLTLYMNDEELCEFKKGGIKENVTVDINPSKAVIDKASRNQKARGALVHHGIIGKRKAS